MNAPLPPGPPPRHEERVSVEQLAAFTDRIDVRSPAEFAEDHIPGAVNLPVLDDAERAHVGTTYVQVGAFEARRLGAAIVTRNIARIVETYASNKAREWRPLVYCWRGGQRSRSLVHVLTEVGWRATQLEGGYRAYRRDVVRRLPSLPSRFRYCVICGLTGSGKSRLIAALHEAGAQVLDLERMARHRGSLLGDLPNHAQPSQKAFESALVAAFDTLDRARIVFVESESKRIGKLQLPDGLLDVMRDALCVRLETAAPLRVMHIAADYAHLIRDHDELTRALAPLKALHGAKTLEHWRSLAESDQHEALIAELLERHYDPIYSRSIERNFKRYGDRLEVRLTALSHDAFSTLAKDVIERMEVTLSAPCS